MATRRLGQTWKLSGEGLRTRRSYEKKSLLRQQKVKILARQQKQLTVLFGNIVIKTRTKTELIIDFHGGTEVNLVTALRLYNIFGYLESLLNPEQKHEMVTAISVVGFPGVLQTEEKHI